MARIVTVAVLAGLATLISVYAEAVKPSYTPGVSRTVASGTTDLATEADYLGAIVWRSATASNKTQTLPGCTALNDGAWIKVVDGQGTASANPIAIAASSGTVVGPASPVEIDLNKGAVVLTCNGASTGWLVTETATVPSTGAGTGDVVGPGSATADHLSSYNGTTGKLIKDSGIATADVGTLAGNQTVTGTKTFNAQPVFPLTHQKVIMGNASDTATATLLSQDIGCADTGACTVTGLQTNKLDTGTPNNGDVLTWHTSGTPAWAPAAPTGGTGAGVSSVASGSPGITISGTGSGPYTGNVTVTQTQPARTTASATIASTDGGSTVINTSGGMTIANATGALGDGFSTNILAVAAATLTPTTATIDGNATEPLGINQGISLFSLSGEYYAILGMPEPVASTLLYASSGRVPTWASTIPIALTWSGLQSFNDGEFALKGSSSGTLVQHAAAVASSGALTWPAGTTDFSATGGTSQFVKQASAGAAFTVVRPACADLSDSGTGCTTTVGTMATQAASAVAITGGTAAGLTGLGIRDTSAAFDLTLAATSSGALTAGHKLTFNVANGDRTVKLASNLTVVTDPGGVTGALKSNGSGTFAQAACADLSNAVASCSALPTIPQAITWVPGINPNNIPIFRANGVRTVTAIVCRPEVAAGGTATVTVVKAASGTALSAGTALHSGSCNANGTAVTDQTLTLVGGATDVLAAGDTIGITTTGTTIWTSAGVATGVVTVYIQ